VGITLSPRSTAVYFAAHADDDNTKLILKVIAIRQLAVFFTVPPEVVL
jgi:hypothetical protein